MMSLLGGIFLRPGALDDKTLAKAFADLQKQKVEPTIDIADEGLLKELQTL